MPKWPVHGRIDGAIVMIGFGSIGRGTLPLIERHFEFDKAHFVVIGPDDADRALLDERGIKFVHLPITRDNYREVLGTLLKAGGGRGFCVNLSVDTSSLDLMRYCREIGALYIDTVVEPWPGFYFDKSIGPESRSNYALRETVLAERRASPAGSPRFPAAAPIRAWFPGWSSRLCSISPRISATRLPEPQSRAEWGALARRLERQGHPYRRARHAARRSIRSRAMCSSTRGRSKVSSPKACSRPNLVGARMRNGRPPNAGFQTAIGLPAPGMRKCKPGSSADCGRFRTRESTDAASGRPPGPIRFGRSSADPTKVSRPRPTRLRTLAGVLPASVCALAFRLLNLRTSASIPFICVLWMAAVPCGSPPSKLGSPEAA